MKIRSIRCNDAMRAFQLPDAVIKVQGHKYIQTVLVGPIMDTMIIGLDFFMTNGALVNLQNHTLTLFRDESNKWVVHILQSKLDITTIQWRR